MKKFLGALAIASITTIPVAQADIVGFEVGGYQWTADYKGTISSDTDALQGSDIDLQNDLGYSDDKNNVIWAAIEHPVPLIPNIKITSSDLDASAQNDLERTIVFNGQSYLVTENVTTRIDLSNIEYTLYYEILDNWVNLDLGLTLRQYDGQVSLVTPPSGTNISEQEDVDFTIPLIYARGRFDLPLTGVFVDAEMNIINYDDDSVSDLMVALGYESDIGLGAKIGYRMFDLDVKDDDLTADLEFDGAYISAFYHF